MARPKKRPDPNVANPLAESSVNRRLWAAYLAKGYTRQSWSTLLGVSYTTVDNWDTETSTPGLDFLIKAAPLVGYSLDELCFGRLASHATTSHVPDSVSAEDRGAFSDTMLELSDAIMPTFVSVYRRARERGEEKQTASDYALSVALDARRVLIEQRASRNKASAVAEAVALGGKAATGFVKRAR